MVAYQNQAVRLVSYQLDESSHRNPVRCGKLTIFLQLYVWLKIKQLYEYLIENKLIGIFKETVSRLHWFAMSGNLIYMIYDLSSVKIDL